jgi:BirA family biotin operon repressor/biotin-[acetyl-CoA-carboxylase] ligase
MQENILRKTLADLPLAQIHYYNEIGSTNSLGLKMSSEGAPEYTLLVAESQTAGRGRFERRWLTKPGASLAFSLVIHPERKEIQKLALFSPLGALAVCAAVTDQCGIEAEIKWPNDVLLDGRKTAGVLAEAAWDENELKGLVLGIGVNLLHASVPPENEILFPATCVQAHCSQPIQAESFLKSIIANLIHLRSLLQNDKFISHYQNWLAYVGEAVSLSKTGSEPVTGTLLGVNNQGELRLKLPDGNIMEFAAGDLSLRLRN